MPYGLLMSGENALALDGMPPLRTSSRSHMKAVSHTYHSSLHHCRHHSQPDHHIFWNPERTALSDT